MINGIVNELKRVILSLLSGFVYIISLSVDSSEYYVAITGKPMALYPASVVLTPSTTSATRQLKNLQMDFLLCYIIIKPAFEYKTKGIYL